MADGTLKDYLVKLGFTVNDKQFKSFLKALNLSETEVMEFADTTTLGMASATVAVVSFVAAANTGIASYLGSLARADMDTELFAKRMWINVEQGKAIQESLKATGRTIEDLWYSEELRGQFIELQKLANDIKPPEGFAESMEGVRDVQLEFMKLRVIMAYISQWVGYYLTQFIAEPIAGIKGDLEDINEFMVDNMPQISTKIAQFLANFIRLGQTIVWIIKGIATGLIEMPDQIQKVAIALAAFFAVASANPFTLAIAGVSMLLLLLEDYHTFTKGGKSAFEDLWKAIGESDQLTKTGESFGDLSGEVVDLIDNVWDLIEAMGRVAGIDFDSTMEGILYLSDTLISGLNEGLELTVFLLDKINELFESLGLGDVGVFDFDKMEYGGLSKERFEELNKGPLNDKSGSDFFDSLKWLFTTPEGFDKTSNSSTYNIEQKFENVNNISGNDPYAIGAEVDNSFGRFGNLIRSVRGPFAT